jgi:16S rRNA (guanine966-N2)-methyltransferase
VIFFPFVTEAETEPRSERRIGLGSVSVSVTNGNLGYFMLYIIGGKYKRRALVAPKSDLVRPTTAQVREAVFNICQNHIEGAHFLDLFAGSGAMGFEALSRGASHVTFVENLRLAQAAIRKNIMALGVAKETTLYPSDVFNALTQFRRESFDVIYIDPPYGKNLGGEVIGYIDHHHLLKETGLLFIEDPSFKEPPLSDLKLHSKRRIGSASLFEYQRKE